MIATERLDEAHACHDDDPQRAAALLRDIDAMHLPDERRPQYGFLVNHVLGEELGCWQEALSRQRANLDAAQAPVDPAVWRHLGCAAVIAGDDERTGQAKAALSAMSGALLVRVDELIDLGVAGLRATGPVVEQVAAEVLAAVAPLEGDAWPTGTFLDAMAAGCANNIANGLLERDPVEIASTDVAPALMRTADLAKSLWCHAGTWVHQERAEYLLAVSCTALGRWQDGRDHALAGLDLLDTHDTNGQENVDRAFLQLERWNACLHLGSRAEAEEAETVSLAVAATFDEQWVTDWFEERLASLRNQRRSRR